METVTALPARQPTIPVATCCDGSPPGRAYLFRVTGKECYAVSVDAHGDSLPHRFHGYSDWVYVRPLDLVAGEHRVGFDVDQILSEVELNGYAMLGSLFGHE